MEGSDKSASTRPSWPVSDSVTAEDAWSWDEDDDKDEKLKGCSDWHDSI